ncbi:hypothetical protein RAS1_07930 [Phycisphaerae bacterium RAS1]|nr:hypothetical protein RAS1_07930 [Phycisphaerae bacterium RAS1]
MVHEFALEPATLATWEQFRYLTEKFGVDNGRLIAQFPKSWKKLVYDAFAGAGDVEKKRIEERLQQESFSRKLTRSNRTYDSAQAWLPNAVRQQEGSDPFRAIIATTNPNTCPSVRIASELDETDRLWSVSREAKIARTAHDLTAVAVPLVRCSRELLIVDPYFDPQVPRFFDVFQSLIREACGARTPPGRLELHCSNARSGTTDHWEGQCSSRLGRLIGANFRLRVVRWAQRAGGETFHARYILTERGGLRFDVGLDAGPPGETTDVTLLDSQLHIARWNDLQEVDANGRTCTPAFEKVDELLISNGGATRIFPT